MSVILSIDQSTQGTKGLVWDTTGHLLSRADVPHRQIISPEGWVSHDLIEIWQNVLRAAKEAIQRANIAADDVAVLGLSNQRETACCWHRKTGEPLCDAIVWQCGRAKSVAQKLADMGLSSESLRITGLPLSPFFSAPKFAWMLENEPAVKAAAKEGNACFGTVDSYLTWKMTGEYVIDCSNASRTGLMDLDTIRWSSRMLEAYGLREDMLPQITMSDADAGMTTLDGLLPRPVCLHARLGDSHAALYAHGCDRPSDTKVTYGTGSSVMLNAGESRPSMSKGVVTSLAWGIDNKVVYCVEGNINYTGALITWLKDDMKMIEKSSESGEIAASISDNGGVYLVPAFSGLGAPYFDNSARAAIIGMDRSSGRAHIVRAAEEAICYQIADVLAAMERATGTKLTRLCADGGPTRDRFLMAFQSGLLNCTLEISAVEELSGAGAAYCAAVAAGLTTREKLLATRKVRLVEPDMLPEVRQKNQQGWYNALKMVMTHKQEV